MYRSGRAVAASIVILVGVVALWAVFGRGTGVAFADVLRQIREVHTVHYKQTVTVTPAGQPAQSDTEDVWILGPSRIRSLNSAGMIMIGDLQKVTFLWLDPKGKSAMLIKPDMPDLPPFVRQPSAPDLLDELKRLDETAARYVGRQEIAGQQALGFDVAQGRETIWVDPNTHLPLLIRRTSKPDSQPATIMTMTDFEWNVPIDESAMSVVPPPGYELVAPQIKIALPGEQDLVKGLRVLAQMNDGKFPEELDNALEKFQRLIPDSPDQPLAAKGRLLLDAMAIVSALAYAGSPANGSDWHYAGAAVALEQPETPVLWYRPKGSWNYRVIYADLAVRDVPPENMPARPSKQIHAFRLPGILEFNPSDPPSEQDLIRSLRTFAELGNNKLPDAVDHSSMAAALKEIEGRQGHMLPSEEVAFSFKPILILHGIGFIDSKNGNDWHYAGKGAELGQAGVPLLWYRPLDGSNYRVIYADMAVQEVSPADLPRIASVLVLATAYDCEPVEQDLIEGLRSFAELNGGKFPDEFSGSSKDRIVRRLAQAKGQEQNQYRQKSDMVDHALRFVCDANGDDWHYAGKGVTLGQTGTPIFWYRPKDAAQYRVIDGDLRSHVVQPEALPTAPSARLTESMVQNQTSEQDLTEALREWAELNDDRFPDVFDGMGPRLSDTAPGTGASLDEITEYTNRIRKSLRISKGVTFINNMVDCHYAGAGVRLDQADTPILWYRTDKTSSYRVVYADLTVRDVTTGELPSVPSVRVLTLRGLGIAPR